MAPGSPDQVEGAEAVFTGRFSKADRAKFRSVGTPLVAVEMSVERVYKGRVHERQTLVARPGGGASCGVMSVDSGPIAVFGYRPTARFDGGTQPPGVYAMNFCSYAPVSQADLSALGPGEAPRSGSSPRAKVPPDTGYGWREVWIATAAIGAVVLAGSLVTMVRRRRTPT